MIYDRLSKEVKYFQAAALYFGSFITFDNISTIFSVGFYDIMSYYDFDKEEFNRVRKDLFPEEFI